MLVERREESCHPQRRPLTSTMRRRLGAELADGWHVIFAEGVVDVYGDGVVAMPRDEMKWARSGKRGVEQVRCHVHPQP